MRQVSRTIRALLLVVISTLIITMAPLGSAQASTDYDNLIGVTPRLSVYTDGATKNQTMDISNTWWDDFKQTHALRIQQNGSGLSEYFVPEFESIMETGGSWGVYSHETTDGVIINLIGTSDPDASCSFQGNFDTGWFGCEVKAGHTYLHTDYFTHYSYGNNGCIGAWANRCSGNGMNLYGGASITTVPTDGFVWAISNSGMSDYKFFIMNFDIQYPTGYSGLIIPSTYTAKYVALGDSFSSGEGNEPFAAGTKLNGANECHRSDVGYPTILRNDSSLNLGDMVSVACSGATTSDVLGIPDGDNPIGVWNEQPQVNALSSHTEIVTITIGGNDVKFREFSERCFNPIDILHPDETCDEFTDIFDDVVDLIENDLPNKLENVYETILYRAPNAEVYIGGYPTIAPNKAITSPFDNNCGGLYDEFPNTWGDARAAHYVVNLLNTTIETVIDSTNSRLSTDRLHFVDVSSGPFMGHDLCEDDSYFNSIDIFNREYSLHPNSEGHLAYAYEFKEVISD